MKQELAWGSAAAMAIVAAVGISSQSGSKPATSASTGRQSGQSVVTAKAPTKGIPEKGALPHCADLIPLLEHFFLHETISGPAVCYAGRPPSSPLDAKFQNEFVIATFPDPLHTHFSLLFDRFVEAIQQGAQDEGYQYDSSWLPWETEDPSLALLKDQEDAEERKEKREAQPGILLFRSASPSPYQKALIVFIVGEESTRGIHRSQFENAVAWVKALQPASDTRTSVAILGPTFSGSFPSLAELLAKTEGVKGLNAGNGFSIYSGSASSKEDGEAFANTKGVQFRSFVQDDTTALNRICQYLQRGTSDSSSDPSNIAILSEDETAYGNSVNQVESGHDNPKRESSLACPNAPRLYYPRDISTLRAAYQTQSMFSSGSAQQNQDNIQRKSLPTELADPSGHQHDTVRTYAGNQTPLSQESQLLGIVDVLRAHRTEYVIIRSSNNLDSLFLANFLRRDYPEARVVLQNSDLLFQRGQDAMALSGVMTLSTYPLFSWAREWTAIPPHNTLAHRVFPENSTEGIYIASRLLLQFLATANGGTQALTCRLVDADSAHPDVFIPPLHCEADQSGLYAPIPDYAPPYWMDADASAPKTSLSYRPATWLSVITRNGTWPLAVLNEHTINSPAEEPLAVQDSGARGEAARDSRAGGQPVMGDHRRWPEAPRSTKILLVGLCCFAVFHALCCRFASYTAKPAFRAHFATPDLLHTWLVLLGSYLIALMALVAGWGCGLFQATPGPPANPWPVRMVVILVCIVTGFSIVENIIVTRKLNGNGKALMDRSAPRIIVAVVAFSILIGAFFVFFAYPLENALSLASRAFAYWRSMNITSGVSPIVPFVSLAIGFYLWFWYALHGLALFGPDRPYLPPLKNLEVELRTGHGEKKTLQLSMFSHEKAGEPAERVAAPLAWGNLVLTLLLFVSLVVLVANLSGGVPVRSLGARPYALLFCVALAFYCSFLLSETWQIWRTWSSARQLLVFLDRMALRRTLSSLHGFSWGSVWKMSGNVLDVRYKLLSRQLECLTHLYNSLHLFERPNTGGEQAAFAGVGLCEESVQKSRAKGMEFAKWYSANYDNPKAADLRDFKAYQVQVAETTGVILSELLVPASRIEKHSLIQVDPEDEREESRKGPPPSKNELIRNAEELVCLTYMGFAQNLLGRIRTIVLGGVYMFIALCVAVSSYPFDPRMLLSGILLFMFVAFGGIVVFTYADMHRDATLSHLTNTKPGELGSEFWFKVIGYGAAPLLGLITQVFPEWAGFLFSWLQPGLSSLK
jgi:hypothetical protein